MDGIKLKFLAEEIDLLLQKVKDGNLDVAISVVSIEGGHRVTINSKSFDVMDGTDANVTAENIAKALGYVPAKNDDIPKSLSDLNNDTGYIDKETDPTVPDWAKTPEKPIYTASEVGAEPAGTASSAVTEHNTATDAHNDIRLLITTLTTRLNALANSTDTELDQMAELVAYIKANRELIEQITTGKVSVTDIINNLTTNVANKPLSAAQGVVLKGLIDALQTVVNAAAKTTDLTSHTENTTVHITAAERTKWNQAVTDLDEANKKIDNYLPKFVGTDKVGKIAIVGTDGYITWIDMPEGSSADVTGVVDEANNILLSGNLASGTYTMRYENEDGTLSEPVTMVVGAIPEPEEPTGSGNLADPTSADWQEGYRLSITSGGTSELAGHIVTNFIPCKAGDVLRVKGLKITGYAGNANEGADAAKIVTYDSSKTKIIGLYGLPATTSDGYSTQVSIDGDISTCTILIRNDGTQKATSECAFIRIDGMLMSGYTSNDVIITINEEIEESDTPNEGNYTNLLPLSVDADGNDYVGDNGEDGYNTGYKLSSSKGTESATSGACVSGYIPITNISDVIRIKNIVVSSAASINNITFHKADKTRIYGTAGSAGVLFASGITADENSVYEFTPAKWLDTTTGAGLGFFRFSCGEITDETIVTVNEEIA